MLSKILLTVCTILFLSGPALAAESSEISSGDTAWLLVSTALVMLMTPGLALFYAGMVRKKMYWEP